eukprot:15349391-Ditylum_brightwellii.AAC.2
MRGGKCLNYSLKIQQEAKTRRGEEDIVKTCGGMTTRTMQMLVVPAPLTNMWRKNTPPVI